LSERSQMRIERKKLVAGQAKLRIGKGKLALDCEIVYAAH